MTQDKLFQAQPIQDVQLCVHPDFEAKATEILNWNISSGSEGELSALKSAISTALRDAYENGKLVSREAATDCPDCDHLITERDRAVDWADRLADAIGRHFLEDVGEHSNLNCPWDQALEMLDPARGPSPARSQFDHQIAEAVADEREACSKQIQFYIDTSLVPLEFYAGKSAEWTSAIKECRELVAAIRARGDAK